jgi:membrane protein YqaA with SNARE-associated domain
VLRKTYDRLMVLAESRQAVRWLALHAFVEGIFFPIPPDFMLMPMVLARRERAWLYAGVTAVCSVLGGTVGYCVGFFLQGFGQWLLKLTGTPNGLEKFHEIYSQIGLIMLALPIPFKLLAIASGLARFDFLTFIIAAAILRSARFFGVAALLRHYGEPVREFVEKRLALVVSAASIALVVALLALKAFLH